MTYKTFKDLPIVRPATADPRNFHDSMLQRTHQSAAESERLDKVLAHYENVIEKEIENQEKGTTPAKEAVIQI